MDLENSQPASNNPGATSQAQPQGAWPPRPTAEGEAAANQPVWYTFTEEYRRVEGNLSDFRTGWIGLSENGIFINGKAALRAEIKTPILILALLVGVGIVIAYIILEYACRSNAALQLGWDQVKKIVISPKARRVCLVFSAPNYSGKVKVFSLAFRLTQPYFDSFVESSRAYAPDSVVEGRIPGATPLVLWILLGIVFALIIAALIIAVSAPPVASR